MTLSQWVVSVSMSLSFKGNKGGDSAVCCPNSAKIYDDILQTVQCVCKAGWQGVVCHVLNIPNLI